MDLGLGQKVNEWWGLPGMEQVSGKQEPAVYKGGPGGPGEVWGKEQRERLYDGPRRDREEGQQECRDSVSALAASGLL